MITRIFVMNVFFVGVCIGLGGCGIVADCVTAPMVCIANSGSFALSGDVVDEEGKPMNGVTLSVTRRWMGTLTQTLKGTGGSSHTRNRNIDGTFDVSVFGAESVSLSFEKEGYYSESFSIDDKRDSARRPNDYMQPDGRARVVLQKKGEQTRLIDRSVTLKFNLDGSGTVVDLTEIAGELIGSRFSPKTVDVEDVRAATMPGIVMYMTVDIDENGRFATKGYPESTPTRMGEGRNLGGDEPARLRLRVSGGENNGFIKQAELPRGGWVGRVMRFAPETGYENEVLFAPEDVVWFYWRIGDKYGRGCLGWPTRVRDDTKTIEVGLKLYIQPDGSRNLETGDRR